MDAFRPQWMHNQFGAWCPSCGEPIAVGSEDYDWGCGCCGYPDERAVADYRAGYDHQFYGDDDD